MKTLDTGTMFELQTPAGLAYLQFVGEVENLGPLFRVLEGLYANSLGEDELKKIANLPHQFMTFFPYVGARRQKLARNVGVVAVPKRFAALPPIINDLREFTGAFHIGFPTGEPELRLVELSEEQKNYPEAGVPAADLLGERIAAGWRPRDWYEKKRWK